MIGADAIGSAPIGADAESLVGSQAKQLSLIVSVLEDQPAQAKQLSVITSINIPQPAQAKQLSAITSIVTPQPVQAKQIAVIVSALLTPIRKYSYARPVRINQATPLYVMLDAPTDDRD